MKTLITTLLFLAMFGARAQEGLRLGDKAPEFEATADDGTLWKLTDNLDKEYLVVYFYPAAMTGGCTAQACAYRDLSDDLSAQNARVVGVSGDNPENLKFFRKAHNLNFTLLSDPRGEVARKFGVPTRDGGTFEGEFDGQQFKLDRDVTTSRWTYVIDKEGTVVYKNEQVNAAKDSEEVLSFLKGNL